MRVGNSNTDHTHLILASSLRDPTHPPAVLFSTLASVDWQLGADGGGAVSQAPNCGRSGADLGVSAAWKRAARRLITW